MTNQRALLAVSGAAALGACALAVAWVYGPGVVREAYAGQSTALLNGAVSGQNRYSVDDYLGFFRHTLRALVAAYLLITAAVLALLAWQRTPRRHPSARAGIVALALLVAVITVDRSRSYGEALERDLTAYMTIAAGLLQGQTLYTELWDHKPPAIHATYELAAAVFGPTPTAIWVLGLLAALLTLWGCYAAGRLVGQQIGGIAAAVAWTLFNGDLLLQANQPNVEVFMNVCLVWAFVLTLQPAEQSRPGRYIVIGLLFFLASLYKPVAAATACAVVGGGALLALLEGRRRGRVDVVGVTRNTLTAGGVAALCWALLLGYYAAVGRLAPFLEAVVEYNRDYAGNAGSNVLRALLPSVDQLWPLLPYVPLGLLAGFMAIAGLRSAERRPWGLLAAYLVGGWIAVALPGRLFPHYFQLMLPPIAIGAGWLIASALERRSAVALAACALAMCGPVAARAYQAEVPLSEVPVMKYGGYGYDCLETQQMGGWINQRYPASAVVYHWGPDPGVYFYAGRLSPVSFTYNLPLVDGTARARRYSEDVLAQLQSRPPDLIVVRRLELRAIDNPIEEWMQEHYQPIAGPAGVERYVFMTPRLNSSKGPPPAFPELPGDDDPLMTR